ncbi:MAG TPA: type III-B CRISPR module RAMP protein Cmr1, partial [Acidobacteriota bacterium]|nr:type III-B CRISPR module RAMP protein Cmr1 [Acidobacteriota bacterium]
MNWKDYQVEIVTHCICAGADQGSAEIRVPSIRGEVRWWFRALGGGKTEEKKLFGGVHGDARRSATVFRIESQFCQKTTANLYDLYGNIQNGPKAYLLWPLRPSRQNDQKRGMILPGSTFTLKCAVRDESIEDNLVDKLDAAIRLWLSLGSLGTRSRRGFGSLRLCSSEPGDCQSLEKFKEIIGKNLSVFGHPKIRVMALNGPFDKETEA